MKCFFDPNGEFPAGDFLSVFKLTFYKVFDKSERISVYDERLLMIHPTSFHKILQSSHPTQTMRSSLKVLSAILFSS